MKICDLLCIRGHIILIKFSQNNNNMKREIFG